MTPIVKKSPIYFLVRQKMGQIVKKAPFFAGPGTKKGREKGDIVAPPASKDWKRRLN
jgi:hypothetical protein